jgi:hypothetical protein
MKNFKNISIKYPVIDFQNVTTLDTAGFETPIKIAGKDE